MATGDDPRHRLLEEAGRDSLLEEAERRRFLYNDVEELVGNGFLSADVEMAGTHIVFRSLDAGDRVKVDSLGGESVTAWKRWFLAASVWMINGFDVREMPNRVFYVHRFWLSELNKEYVNALMFIPMALHRKTERAHQKVEAYCYEPYGRGLWRVLHTTISTTSSNTVYKVWTSFNEGEDKREEDRENWGRTQTVVASMSNKGGKTVRRQLDLSQSREESRRARVIEEMVNYVIHGEKEPEELTVLVNGKPVKIPRMTASRSVADMQEEMRKAMEGERDLHDLAVENYEQRLRNAVQQRQERLEGRQRQNSEIEGMMRQAGIGGNTRMVGYSPAQMAQANPNVKNPVGVKKVATNSDARRLYDRYVKGGTRIGVIGTSGKPEAHRDPTTLQEDISQRKPSLRSDPMGPSKVRGNDGD